MSNVPGYPSTVNFHCVVTSAAPYCDVGVCSLNINFSAPDATHFALVFQPAYVCGATAGTCTPLNAGTNSDTTSVSATLSNCVYTVTDAFNAYFPCSQCFGGERPLFGMTFTATSSAAC